MSENIKPSQPHQSTTYNNDASSLDNKAEKLGNCDSIIFDKDVTSLIESEEVVVDKKELQYYQQQVADEIQLQFMGTIDRNVNNNEPLSLLEQPIQDDHLLKKIIAKFTGGNHTFIIVLLVHVFIISIALIFGRVDISGIKDIPITPSSATSLPPLKSYLMTQAEYDKLVERTQLNSAKQSAEVEAEILEVTPETSTKQD